MKFEWSNRSMKKAAVFILMIFAVQAVSAQNTNRSFVSFSGSDGRYELEVSDGVYEIHYYNPYIVETTFIPDGEEAPESSHAVIMESGPVTVISAETNQAIAIQPQAEGISIQIKKDPFQIFYYKADKLLTSEKSGYQKSDEFEKIEMNLNARESLYGAGARALGMDRRGNKLRLYNQAHYGYGDRSELLNYTMPIVLSSEGYLVHFDNPSVGFLDLDSEGNNTLTFEAVSGPNRYQVVAGDSWMDIIANYTILTGKQPMLPRWALGNFSSRFGYHSQEEVLETATAFREQDIPMDAIILDLYWFGKEIQGTMGNLSFYTDSFPDPQQMIDKLRSQDVETVLITEPFILTTSDRWEEAVNANILAKDSLGNPYTYDFYFGNTALIDVFSEQGYLWFKDIYKDLLDMGVTGMWGDLGEPEVHPSDMVHATGKADEVHNIYGHQWAKLVYDAYREYDANLRPFILMRAGYSGSQRYGIIPWSGDVSRSWGGLKSQLEISLQMGMQGIAWMHSDLGGFAGDVLDDELYARWLQYGVFQPIYRPHAQESVPSEPVFRSDSAKALSREAIKLRYQMLPYNYNLMVQNHLHGKPLMRPLLFEEPDNYQLYDYAEAYLWGDDFLIAPVVEPGAVEKEVYFPAGSDWIDFYSGEPFTGGQSYTVNLNDETIPTYIRAGAFVPLSNAYQTTKAYSGEELTLHYYQHASVSSSQDEYFHDEGHEVNAIEKGVYEKWIFSSEQNEDGLKIILDAEQGEAYESMERSVDMVIHGVNSEPAGLLVNGSRVVADWDNETGTLRFPLAWDTGREMMIEITL